MTDQKSIIRFIEDNWKTGRIGDYPFGALAGDLHPVFDFSSSHRHASRLFLNPATGQVPEPAE